jgi:hypothetical protein
MTEKRQILHGVYPERSLRQKRMRLWRRRVQNDVLPFYRKPECVVYIPKIFLNPKSVYGLMYFAFIVSCVVSYLQLFYCAVKLGLQMKKYPLHFLEKLSGKLAHDVLHLEFKEQNQHIGDVHIGFLGERVDMNRLITKHRVKRLLFGR